MSGNDFTHKLNDSDEGDNTTQPTITAVFRLLREVKEGQERLSSRLDQVEESLNSRIDQVEKGLNSRIDQVENGLNSRIDQVEEGLNSRIDQVDKSLNSRIDALESQLAHGFEAVNIRFADLSEEFKTGLLRLSDKLCDRIDRVRLHAEADYEDLLRRLRKLESKAS